jgi:hypothetical protein
MANPEHLEILKQDVEIWNQWRRDRPGIPNLGGVNLSKEAEEQYLKTSRRNRLYSFYIPDSE